MTIRPAEFPEETDLVRSLFREYASWLNVDLCFQGFDDELASLPGKYARPAGVVLLATERGHAMGCIALRPFEAKVAEMKRLWVRPQGRRHGLGARLVAEVERVAASAGYEEIVLDTLRTMEAAVALYRRMGYEETEAYYHNPLPAAVYFRKRVTA